MVAVGKAVKYVDHQGVERDALVTTIHGPAEKNPSINVVFVSGDESRQDGYGRQTEHDSSVVHKSQQYAHGNYWYE